MGALEHTVSFAASSGNFLVSPNLGLMIWTLVAFLITLFVLKRLAFPRIQEALDKRQKAIDESIEAAERARREADALLDEYRQRLKDKGVRVGPVLNHDESDAQVSPTVHPGVYVRSFYFHDPDGITLEFACWTREFTENDTTTAPKNAAYRRPRVPAGR